MAKLGGLTSALKSAKSSGVNLFCGYCGTETITINRRGICSTCEMPIEQDKATFSERNAELFQTIMSIKGSMGKGDFDGAAKLYEDAFAKYHDPGFLYAESLVRIKQSNAAIAQIRYDREGFMEENIAYRSKGALLVSNAKLLLSKAINVCNAAIASGLTPGTAYLLFLCYTKMGNQRAAKSALTLVGKSGNAYLAAYAKMMHDAATRDYMALDKDAMEMLVMENFSANAMFYYALATLKRGDMEGTKHIISEVSKVVHIGSIDLLQDELEKFEKSFI